MKILNFYVFCIYDKAIAIHKKIVVKIDFTVESYIFRAQFII